MSKNLYMHTINGRPAMYEDGSQIVYINKWNRINFSEVFVSSLAAIKRQQQWTRQYRTQNGWTEEPENKYGYIRINDDGEHLL